MRSNDTKKAVYEALASVDTFSDNTDRLIASCLLFDYIKKLLSNDTGLQNNAKNLAASYSDLFIETLASFKKKFVSYNAMRDLIESYRRDNFITFTDQQVIAVVRLYQDKTLIAPFSTKVFSQYMYKVIKVNRAQYDRLRKIHFEVVVPIIRFYMDNYGLGQEDIEIESGTEYPATPGKEILFSIKDVTPSKVVSDIKSGMIDISVFSAEVKGRFIRLINR
jgi:hypothetical protein